MREKIGKTAGEIWKILHEKENLNITQLPKILNKNEILGYQALGWLAREGKINYHTKGKSTFISLVESEKNR
jgi:hypothetical protein